MGRFTLFFCVFFKKNNIFSLYFKQYGDQTGGRRERKSRTAASSASANGNSQVSSQFNPCACVSRFFFSGDRRLMCMCAYVFCVRASTWPAAMCTGVNSARAQMAFRANICRHTHHRLEYTITPPPSPFKNSRCTTILLYSYAVDRYS